MMAYGDYDGQDKADKGKEGGSCNRTRCQCAPARWYNHDSYSWYCDECRQQIEFDPINSADWQRNFYPRLLHPMFETREMMDARQNPPPQSNTIGDDSPRYSMKRMRDEIAKAKEYARREALTEAAVKAHSLIAMDYVADHVRDQILLLAGGNPWLPIDQADKGIAYIHAFGPIQVGNSYPIWARDSDGRAFECLWADDGKRAYWWDSEAESPVDPVEFMPHPLDPRFAATTEGSAE